MRLPSLEQSQPGLYEELTFNFLPDDPVVTVRHSKYRHSRYSHSKYNFLTDDPVVTVRTLLAQPRGYTDRGHAY